MKKRLKKSPIQPVDLNPFYEGDIADFQRKLKAKELLIAAKVNGWWDITVTRGASRQDLIDIANFLLRKAAA